MLFAAGQARLPVGRAEVDELEAVDVVGVVVDDELVD